MMKKIFSAAALLWRNKGIILILVGLFLFAPSSKALDDLGAFTISNFDVDILVREDAVLEVKEMIDVDFSEKRHGIFRSIPVKYKNDKGFEYNMYLKILSIENGEGEEIPYEISSSGNNKIFKIGDADVLIEGAQKYVIEYEVKKGVRYFDDHDEIFWNPIGTGWPTTIAKASSTVKFEDGMEYLSDSGVCFTGDFGSKKQDCSVDEKIGEVVFEADDKLDRYQGLTIAVHLPKGEIYEPTQIEYVMMFLRDNWGFGLPVVVFVLMYLVWLKKGKEINLKKTIIAHYEAPNNLSPGEVGYLLKEKYPVKFVTADIINLAVKGYLDIYEIERKGAFKKFKKQDYELENKKDWDKSKDLTDHEKELLFGLFGSNKLGKIKLSSKKNSFYRNIQSADAKVKHKLQSEGYYEISVLNKKGFYSSLGVIGGIGLFMIGAIFLRPDILFGSIISIPIVAIFGFFMSKKTQKGAEAYWQAKGYKEYIDVAEKHRAEFQAKENLFEKTLPYAMVFGNIDKWAKAFEGIAKEQPDWYHSRSMTAFHPAMFATSISEGFSSATQAASVSPQSSSSGGGGFSGGGGGGGGGGSW